MKIPLKAEKPFGFRSSFIGNDALGHPRRSGVQHTDDAQVKIHWRFGACGARCCCC
ncbi:hypothetical protein V6Z11_D07G159500 [Gossypium hirsutum]